MSEQPALKVEVEMLQETKPDISDRAEHIYKAQEGSPPAKNEAPDIKLEFDPPVPINFGLPRAPSSLKEEGEELYDISTSDAPIRSPSAEIAEGFSADYKETSSASRKLRSRDITTEIGDLLNDKKLRNTGTFAFTRGYPDAPNPVLELKGAGVLGFPLSSRSIVALQDYGSDIRPDSSAPEVTSERVALADICSHWEVDESKVVFHNTGFITFVEKICLDVRLTLGILVETKCRLSRILFQEQQKCIQYNIAKTPCAQDKQVVGTIAIVLPAQYVGGDAEVTHGDDTIKYSPASHGAFAVSCIAWRVDATIKLHPLTQGCRTLLIYNLTTDVEPPSKALLPVYTKLLSRLRKCFSSWAGSRGRGSAPFKIISLLPIDRKHPEPRTNLRKTALTSSTARLVSVVEALALPFNLRLGLASVTGYREGSGPENRDSDSSQYGQIDWDTIIDSDSTSVENLVDLRGRLLLDNLSFEDESDEMAPYDFNETVFNETDEVEEYLEHQDWDGNWVTVRRAYHRTVLVIWPPWANDGVLRKVARALEIVKACRSSRPQAGEQEALETVLDGALPADAPDALPDVARVALSWKDLPLWLRAVQAYDGDTPVQSLDWADIHAAYKTFGFAEVQAVIQRALSKDSDTIAALDFLEEIRTWDPEDTGGENTLENFVHTECGKILNDIKEPLEDELPQLLVAAHVYGGDDLLETVVIPRVKTFKKDYLLFACVDHIQTMAGHIHPDACRRLAEDLLVASLSVLDIYRLRNAYRIEQYIRLCVRVGRGDLCTPLFSKLTTLPATWGARQRLAFSQEVLLPFLMSVDRDLGLPPVCFPDLVPARRLVATALLEAVRDNPPRPWHTSDFTTLTTLVEAGAPWEPCLSNILSALPSIALGRVLLYKLLRALLKGHPGLISNMSTSGLDEHVRALVDNYLATMTPSRAGPLVVHANAPDPSFSQQLVDAVELCCGLGLPQVSSNHISQVLSSAASNRSAKEQRDFILILAPSLRDALLAHQQSPMSELFAPVFHQITLHWVLDIMGPRPENLDHAKMILADVLKAWTCKCRPCSSTKAFLSETADASMKLEHLGRKRQHVEQELQQHASQLVRWRVLHTSPIGLTLTKTDPVSGVIRWETYRKEGLQLLRTLAAEDADRQNILGPDTEWIGKLLEHGIPRDQVSPVEAGSAEPSVAPVEEAPLAVKRPRSPSPLPFSFDALQPDGTVDADRRPMKRERSQSVVIKTEMDVDRS